MKFATLASAAPLLIVLALALSGCDADTPGADNGTTTAPSASATADGPCDDVTVVVDFGTLDADSVHACAPAGAATAALKAADITTEGTADYGDQVVCRVDDLPAPADETCATLPSTAYWALWVKSTADGDWEYAQEGVATLQLTSGQSLGLVYTAGTDSTPPKD